MAGILLHNIYFSGIIHLQSAHSARLNQKGCVPVGASQQVQYRPSFRVLFLSFDDAKITRTKAKEIIQCAYEGEPWRVGYTIRRPRPLRDIVSYDDAVAVVSFVREIQPNVSYEFVVSIAARITPSQLHAFEEYRGVFARLIRDAAPGGFWNANVEVHLSSAEPYAAFSPDTDARMTALSSSRTAQ